MSLQLFFHPDLPAPGEAVTLGEEASKHIISVLRMQVGERMILADGMGRHAEASITGDHRKRCEVRVSDIVSFPRPVHQVTLAVSPLKHASRYEWMLEKATEIGVHRIVPLICQRTGKAHLKLDRLQAILLSGMLQSRQAWLPVLDGPTPFLSFVAGSGKDDGARLIAHCMDGEKRELNRITPALPASRTMLIGPEGDFTPEELALALASGFTSVGLGSTRLRTETAALVAAVQLVQVL